MSDVGLLNLIPYYHRSFHFHLRFTLKSYFRSKGQLSWYFYALTHDSPRTLDSRSLFLRVSIEFIRISICIGNYHLKNIYWEQQIPAAPKILVEYSIIEAVNRLDGM
jgi:hypothetical protein